MLDSFGNFRQEVFMRRESRISLVSFGFLLLVGPFAISAFSSSEAAQQPMPSEQLSHVRVVRLSFIEGTVTMRRPGSTEWASALVNTPIQEKFSVATGKRSFAEIQFEDGSSMRLGELSGVDFVQLALTPEGGHINHLTLDQGYATFHVTPERYDEYLVRVSDVSVSPRGKAEFRTDLDQDHLRVEVFEGHVQAGSSNHVETLTKNHALIRDIDPSASFQITDKIQKDDWDKWTDAREQQSTLAVNEEAVSSPTPRYGWDDLDVYGEWGYFPGYGNGWAPYEPWGWSPYSAGMWDWYAGMGYTWISGEPWGWLPFHYGFWNFDPAMGWFWMPGSFGAWSPALVNWYSGAGWIGWTPVGAAGVGGSAPCTLAAPGCLTAVPPSVLGGHHPIRPGSPHLIHPASTDGITAIARPDVVPERPTPPSRPSTPGSVNISLGRIGQQAASSGARAPAGALSASRFRRGREAAPSSIIIGRVVSSEAFSGLHSSDGTAYGNGEPIRVRLGGTIGGQFPARNAVGSASGWGFHGASGAPSINGGPRILSRTSAGDFSRSRGEFGSRGGDGSHGVAQSEGVSSGVSGGGAGASSHGGSSSSSGSSSSAGGHR
jgi:hypothetical protein